MGTLYSRATLGQVRGNFPWFLTKTDEDRIQNAPWLLEQYKNTEFYISEKIDGSSFSAFYLSNLEMCEKCHIKPENVRQDGTYFGACSRNLELKETEENAYWETARLYQIEEKLKYLSKSYAIQGEMYGQGICGNKLQLSGIRLAIFNVKDLEADRFLDFDEMINFCTKLELPTVPIIDFNFILKEGLTISDLLLFSNRKSVINPNVLAEGLVYRPLKETEVYRFGRLSFKVISNEWLLKYKE